MEISAFKLNDIQVTSVYFKPNQVRFESFPRRLVYKGREYVLVDA